MVNLPKDGFSNLADTKKVAKTMADAVELCKNNHFYTPALVLIAASIDRLAGSDKDSYLAALEKNFPELCMKLGASVFYSKYRNGIIHEFSPKKGFAIGNDNELNGKYIDDVRIDGKEPTYTTLNVDKLIADFIVYARSVENGNAS